MAIITRWACPPEIWCGNARDRCWASGMPTLASISSARSQPSERFMRSWTSYTSAIWNPTR